MRTGNGQEPDTLTREAFIRHLRNALNHLSDPRRLRENPLAALLGVADRFDTFSALQGILADAIESLKPGDGEPSPSHAWQIYDLLFCRYVQQCSQQVVADQLGMSPRSLRRVQQTALEALADHLWRKFELQDRTRETGAGRGAAEEVPTTSPSVNEELAWLSSVPPDSRTDPDQALREVLALAQPLADRYGVRLEASFDRTLPDLAVHPVAVNQALLNLLGATIPRAENGQVTLSVQRLDWELRFTVACAGSPSRRPAPSHEGATSLEMAHRLADLSRGRLDVADDGTALSATLVLPVVARFPVLVIDDNADTLRLFERYASGTRYRLVGVRHMDEALGQLEAFLPQIILLDVMMPETDGWKVMGRLSEHPATQGIPIVVCTILAQEELALSLGASAFIRKPVTRQSFLAALDRLVTTMEIEPD